MIAPGDIAPDFELAQDIREEVEANLASKWRIPEPWVGLSSGYTASREDVRRDEDYFAFSDALCLGYSLRIVEVARPDARPIPADVVARLTESPGDNAGLLEILLDLVGTWTEPSTSRLPEIITLTGEPWSEFEYWAHQHNVSRSRGRQRAELQAFGDDTVPLPSMVDFTHALWFGYALRCCAEVRDA